jgi:hypothetical protein
VDVDASERREAMVCSAGIHASQLSATTVVGLMVRLTVAGARRWLLALARWRLARWRLVRLRLTGLLLGSVMRVWLVIALLSDHTGRVRCWMIVGIMMGGVCSDGTDAQSQNSLELVGTSGMQRRKCCAACGGRVMCCARWLLTACGVSRRGCDSRQ